MRVPGVSPCRRTGGSGGDDATVRPGSADRGGHGRPIGASAIHPATERDVVRGRRRDASRLRAAHRARRGDRRLPRAHVDVRRVGMCTAAPVTAWPPRRTCTPPTSCGRCPRIAAGAAVGAALVVASASRAGIAALTRLGLPGLGRDARARANGLTWGAIAVLGVHFTGEAFDVFPGGQSVAAVVLGALLGVGTYPTAPARDRARGVPHVQPHRDAARRRAASRA